MNLSLLVSKSSLATCMTLLAVSLLAGESSDDLKPIFNGKDFTGWKVPEPNFWKVVDGVLVGENDPANKGSMLWTEKSYQDFVLEFESRWTGEVDSGVMFRKASSGKRELQVQLGISRSQKRDLTGSFYTGGKEKYPELGQVKNLENFIKLDKWNKYRIEAKGETFTVWLNGKEGVKYANTNYSLPGPIGFQVHPGLPMRIEFRNIRASELK